MSQKREVIAKTVRFPVIKGNSVAFVVESGQVAQTKALNIVKCEYKKAEKKLYISVESRNTRYTASVAVCELPNCSHDQIIEVGQTVLNAQGTPVIVADIIQISETNGVVNVIFNNSNGETFATPFILA